MLILRRKIGERIHIGPDIVVTLVRDKRGGISLAIEAPSEVRVLRGEVHDRIERIEREGVER